MLFGDFYFDDNRSQSKQLSCMRNLLTEYNLVYRDINRVGYTFLINSLQQYSLSDYLYICSSDMSTVKESKVVDPGSIMSLA